MRKNRTLVMSKDNKNKQTPYQSIVDIAEHIPNNELLKQLTAESDKKKKRTEIFRQIPNHKETE